MLNTFGDTAVRSLSNVFYIVAFLNFSIATMGCQDTQNQPEQPNTNTSGGWGGGGSTTNPNACPPESEVLSAFVLDGQHVIITTNGEALFEVDGVCTFAATYFVPGFEEAYVERDGGVFRVTDQGEVPVRLEHVDDFSTYDDFVDLFPVDIAEVEDHFFTAFILQSPQYPSVEAYVDLRRCILEGTCEPTENRIDLVEAPDSSGHQALRFLAVPPNAGEVSKCSIQSNLPYYVDGDEVWIQARFLIESGMPYSLMDVETDFFLDSPGPRVVTSNGRLAFENKFGAKRKWSSQEAPLIPLGEWFTVTLYILFDDQENGHFEIYQNGSLVLEGDGVTLPTSNSIQNSVEVGITATSQSTVMYMDDFVLSSSRP